MSESLIDLDDPVSLAANCAGQITPAQRARLRTSSLVVPLAGLVNGGALFLLLGLGMLQAVRGAITAADEPPLTRLIILAGFLIFIGLGCAALIWGCRPLLPWYRLKGDVNQRSIVQADAQVTFLNGGYGASVFRQPLFAANGSHVLDLPPGSYRFYFLRRTRRILSAERLATDGAGSPETNLLAALAAAHGFTMGDLATNRQGWLSVRQRSRLLRAAVIWMAIAIAGMVALLLLRSPDLEVGVLVIFFLITLLLLYIGYMHYADMLRGRVATLAGVVTKRMDSDSDGGNSYHYVVGRERFTVSGAAYNALIPGLYYRLYYGPKSKNILSIEPVSAAPF